MEGAFGDAREDEPEVVGVGPGGGVEVGIECIHI